MTSGSKTDGAKAFASWHNQGLTKPAKRARTEPARQTDRFAKPIVDIAPGKPPDGDPTPEEPGKDAASAARAAARAGKPGPPAAALAPLADGRSVWQADRVFGQSLLIGVNCRVESSTTSRDPAPRLRQLV